ncbi:BEM_collapsed_G0002020.mRNA.1.CDS.1 [Saccharomyces cerevisiae]|nr:BEM_collapsed_G0002020.mRNA.1.CDS.1 [Saccharomyces cerevisiae]
MGFIQDDHVRSRLISSLISILKGKLKNCRKMIPKNFENIKADSFQLQLTIHYHIFFCSKHLTSETSGFPLTELFIELGRKVPELESISKLVADLNSYSSSRMHEYDFPRILSTFKGLIEDGYKSYSDLLTSLTKKPNLNEASKSISMLKDILLPSIRIGLRDSLEEVQSEYVSVLSYMVKNTKHFTDFEDMAILLYNGDEEADFLQTLIIFSFIVVREPLKD